MDENNHPLPTNRKTKTANLLDMTKETIMNTYAIKQGYDDLRDLLRYSDLDEVKEIIDSVTDLI